MYGPNVNFKFYKEFIAKNKENIFHSLIDIRSCSLHTVHGTFRTGTEKTDWNLEEALKGAFHTFHDTPARRDDYESITGSKIYPLYFCSAR